MEGPFVFRLNDNGTGPHLLIQVQLIRLKLNSQHPTETKRSPMKFSIKHDRNHRLIVIQSARISFIDV